MYRPSGEFSKKLYLDSESRLNEKATNKTTDEGCPVIEESGTVCGETSTLCIFQEFRQIYDECLQKLEETQSDNIILKKLIPFRKLVEHLWEQNSVLVETFEELEQEATSRVINLQEKLNKSCEKIVYYKEDIKSLTKIIKHFKENGFFDFTGLKFNTLSLSEIFGDCESRNLSSKKVRDFEGYENICSVKTEQNVPNQCTYSECGECQEHVKSVNINLNFGCDSENYCHCDCGCLNSPTEYSEN